MKQETNLEELLNYIDPVSLDYTGWLNVGMALKHEGYSVDVWDSWSARDSRRYKPKGKGSCADKWDSFREDTADIVTGGTIYQMAVNGGYRPDEGHELGWDDEIENPGVVIAPGWIEGREFSEPKNWHPGREAARYIETLFEPGETIGYVMNSRYDMDRDKYVPNGKGVFTNTAGKKLEDLAKYGDDLDSAMGNYNPKGGAWIRFNPLDGKGVQNKNVAEFRYALVESDTLDLEKQNSIVRELELPIAVLMYSGGKSLHAIVRIEAPDYREYQKRVEFLYSICEKNGLEIDAQNKNPSRLSRLPGCQRGDKKQFIIDTNIGKSTWNEWKEWIDAVNDNLPEMEDLGDIWGNLPSLADPLIDGILRKGHKMLLSGPSKAGKSFLQIELAIAIAEGRKWLGRQCAQGKILYVNLEVDRASCLHRFKDVYDALGWPPNSLKNITVWNLRGKSVSLDKLAPMLIRRAQKRGYAAVIIDPIYKVITGDENSAEQMAKFCNQFDKICAELGCATIYCHHHSKGAQGDKKAMDRASGSGVFARDPDAQLDMIQLELTDEVIKKQKNDAQLKACLDYLESSGIGSDDLSYDDLLNPNAVLNYCENTVKDAEMMKLRTLISEAQDKIISKTAWRLEATLREFPGFKPINVWFDYPVHKVDLTGELSDIQPESEVPLWMKAKEKTKQQAKQHKKDKTAAFNMAFADLSMEGKPVKADDMASAMGTTSKALLALIGNDKQRRINDLAANYEKYQEGGNGSTYIRLRK